ncbi:MAG: pyridoxal phosphate-dependent aminotransferase [Stomatobaculum sp.]|nr:pyridoxal phosphate-dependent aminotransferase [Stomatobaculum sp.]MBR7057259.1 pyridoxal phosphate-dependent aminotransferase [Stomatobaculum sp.]
MISEKMKPLVNNNSAIRAMFEEGNRLAALYGRENVYDFSLGNPNVPAPKEVKQALLDVLNEEDSCFVNGYMSNAGYPDTRKAVADSLNRRFGTAYGPQNLIMTVGAASAINIFLKTILDPGDEVVTFAPYFVEYGNYVRNYDGILRVVPANTRDFQPDIEGLRAAVTSRTKAVIINTPNNPTGIVYSEETLRALQNVIAEKEAEYGTVIITVSDEPYRELAYDGVKVPWVPDFLEHAVVVYSYSKSLSLPGQRIGWLLIPDSIPEAEEVISAATIANRVCGAVNAPSLIQRALIRCIDASTDIEAYNANRELLYGGLKELGFECAKPQGAFYLFVKAPDGDDARFVDVCKKYNVLVVPGKSFACAGYVRLAYCVSNDMIRRSLPAFRKIAEEYGL